MSEDGGFSTPRHEKPRALHREERIDRNAFSADLEAELLQELESSFASRAAPLPPTSRSAPPPLRSAPPVQVQPIADTNDPADDADDLLRSIEEQLGQFERNVHLDVSREVVTHERAPALDPEPETTETLNLDEPFDNWSEEAAQRFDDHQDYRFRGPAGMGRAPEQAELDDTPVNASDVYRDQGEVRFEDQAETGEAGVYSELETPQPEDLVRQDGESRSSQREWRATAAQAARERRAREADEERPLEDIDLSGVEAGLSRAMESEYADPTYPADPGEWDGEAHQATEGARLAVTALPERSAPPPRVSSRGRGRSLMLTAASVIAVVLVAGAAAMYLQSGDEGASGPPPLITAEEGEVKIQPPQTEAVAEPETAGEAVYDRVAGNAPATDGEIVDSAEEPREIARIILPPSQTPDTEEGVRQIDPNAANAADSGATAAAEAPAGDEIGPRRVPTYVIRPDGSVVTTAEAGVTEPTTQAAPPVDIAAQTEAIEPIAVQTTSIGPEGDPSPVTTPAAEIAPAPEPAPAVATAPAPAELPIASEDIAAPEAEVAAVAPEQPAAPAPDAPVNLLDETAAVDPAPAPVAPPTAASGYLVQISSQRSEERRRRRSATCRAGSLRCSAASRPTSSEADLGEQGIYFRVRVGPWATRAEAIEVCEALKAAGGNCFVTQ